MARQVPPVSHVLLLFVVALSIVTSASNYVVTRNVSPSLRTASVSALNAHGKPIHNGSFYCEGIQDCGRKICLAYNVVGQNGITLVPFVDRVAHCPFTMRELFDVELESSENPFKYGMVALYAHFILLGFLLCSAISQKCRRVPTENEETKNPVNEKQKSSSEMKLSSLFLEALVYMTGILSLILLVLNPQKDESVNPFNTELSEITVVSQIVIYFCVALVR
jgi:hypothetical protein